MKRTTFINGKYLLAALFAAGMTLTACNKDNMQLPGGGDGAPLKVKAGVAAYSGGDSDSAERFTDLQACVFDGGRMTRVYENLAADSGNIYEIDIDGRSGTLYMVANAAGLIDLKELQSQGISEEEWLKTIVASGNSSPIHFLSGSASLEGSSGVLPLTLRRGVARFDLKLRTAGEAGVRSISLKDAAGSAYLFPAADRYSPEGAPLYELKAEFGEPLSADTPGVLYVHEQQAGAVTVSVDAVIDGRPVVLESRLEEPLERNTVYSVTVRKDDIDVSLQIEVEDWQTGGDTELVPDRSEAISFDAGRSDLPEGAFWDDGGRTLVLPHGRSDFLLAFESPDELELLPFEGKLLEILPEPSGAGFNSFRVSKGLFAPEVPGQEVTLRFRRRSLSQLYVEDTLTLRLLANPVALEGGMSFDNAAYTHDFGRYADNEFGVFRLPEDKTISVEFPAGEDPWLKLDGDPSGRSFRVLGGWRPNDATADGREQKAVVVICDADGSGREEYSIVRRNYGLPVTWLHGVWWCKYNARGDSRSFEDQVLSSADPAAAAGMSVMEYLGSCSPEEFYSLWGWAYQGGSGRGLKVVELDGKAVMEGYSDQVTDHINLLPADALSPDGYELASFEDFGRVFDATDYVWLMWNGTHRIKEPWDGHDLIKREQRRRNDISAGATALPDLIYIGMQSPDFPEHEPVVWYGPGAQWNSDGILHSGHYNNMLFAASSASGQGWFFAGGMSGLYLNKNGAGAKDTRILRFKKSDVEYIY